MQSIRARLLLDLSITGLVLMEMSYLLTGGALHEWLGALLFLLVFIHNLLNRRWYAALFRGSCSPLRRLNNFVNIMLGACMLCILITGIILSQVIVPSGWFQGSLEIRELHTFAAHWGFVLIGIHIGLHWTLIFRQMNEALPAVMQRALPIYRLAAFCLCCLGIYVWFSRDILMSLTLQASFSFRNEACPAAYMPLEYLLILSSYIWLTHYLLKVLRGNRQ